MLMVRNGESLWNGTINAEMVIGVKPAWYFLKATPGQVGIAAAHLVGRRFGICIPDITHRPKVVFDRETRDYRVERGEKLPGRTRMLGNYILVFAWLDDKNYQRLRNIPGITGFVTIGERPYVVADSIVRGFRELETLLSPVEIPEEWTKPKSKRRGWRKRRIAEHEEKTFEAIKGYINVGGGQWIDTIETLRVLDGRDENQSIARSLCLAS